MGPWMGNIIFIVSLVTSIAIRIPHDKVSQEAKIVESRFDLLEKILMGLVLVGMIILPVLSFTHLLDFASYEIAPVQIILGALVMLLSLWLFRRSHKDLGRNWSKTLEIREAHTLTTNGVYKSIRHPMYTSLFLFGIGQLLLLSNWVAAPSFLVAFSLMFFSRLKTEEKLMLDKFGNEYELYRGRTKRIIPGVW